MTNGSIALIFYISAAVTFLNLLVVYTKRKDNDASIYLAFLCIACICWSLCSALFYALPNDDIAIRFHECRLAFVSSISVSLYLFLLAAIKKIKLGKIKIIALYIVPVMTFVIALFDERLSFMRTSVDIVPGSIRMIDINNGIWFYAHCAYSYVVFYFSLTLNVKQYLSLPKNYRTSVLLMLVGIIISLISTLLAVFNLMPSSIDFTAVIASISIIFYSVGLYNTKSLDTLFASRDLFFNDAENQIFVLDTQRTIIDYNKKAGILASTTGFDRDANCNFDEMLKKWMDTNEARIFEDDESIITINSNGMDLHLQISEKTICSNNGKCLGVYVEIENVTPIMSIIHKLQDKAFYDQLTGLYNRHSFTKYITELDTNSALPLGVLVGDINGLKRVNDTHGHSVGDDLLKLVVRAIRGNSPERAIWARVGGDEFSALIPNTDKEEMDRIVNSIESECKNWTTEPFAGAGIAMAYKLRTDRNSDISTLLHEADVEMYSVKRDRRANR